MSGPESLGGQPESRVWLWRTLSAFWLLMLVPPVVALIRGQPNAYPYEHARAVLLPLGSLFLALSFLARRGVVRSALLSVSLITLIGALVATVWPAR